MRQLPPPSQGYAFCEYVDNTLTEYVIQSLNGKPVGSKFLTVKRALGPAGMMRCVAMMRCDAMMRGNMTRRRLYTTTPVYCTAWTCMNAHPLYRWARLTTSNRVNLSTTAAHQPLASTSAVTMLPVLP